MENKKKTVLKNWKLLVVVILIILIITAIFYISTNDTEKVNSDDVKKYKIGDIITLNEYDKATLRNKTIEYIEDALKAPSTAEFQNEFEYICNEENIIKVSGYVESQNSFGTMIRGKFRCEYFAIENTIDTLVYFQYDDKELLNIKNRYIEEYKKQQEIKNIKSIGNKLSQEKLEYIMNEFNNDETNDTAKVTYVFFDENESIVNIKINAKTEKVDNYWINFNICTIMDYIKEFDLTGTIKIKLDDKEKNVEINFNDEFVKHKWKENHQINLVKEIFGENYKETSN